MGTRWTEASVTSIRHRLDVATQSERPARRLATVPGIGAVTGAALQALVPDPRGFASARHFAASSRLAPQSHSSRGKERPGGISKAGNSTLRRLPVLGATSRLRHAKRDPDSAYPLARLSARKPAKVAAVAQANRMACIAWALLTRGWEYRRPAAA
jgi:transposase